MKVRAIIREAWRNVISGTTRTVVLTVILGSVLSAALAAEILTVARMEADAAEFRDAGGSVLTITAEGRVDGRRCESLSRVPEVRSAGAVTLPRGQQVTAVALPGAPMQAAIASRGFPAVLGADGDGGHGLVLPGSAAEVLGLTVGAPLATTSGETRVAGTYEYPLDGRRSGYGYLALAIVPSANTFDECWVDVWPQNPGMNALLFTTLMQHDSTDKDAPSVQQLNAAFGMTFDGNTVFHERVTRFAAPLVSVFAALIGLAATRTRRIELAAALHDNMRRHDMWMIALLESASWLVVPFIATVAAAALSFGAGGDFLVGLALGARIAVAGAVGSLVGVFSGLLMTREKDLFAYSKDR